MGGWEQQGFRSFGEYVERELGTPAEVVLLPDGKIRPTHVMARLLDEWSPAIPLAATLFDAAHSLEWERFLEIHGSTGEPESRIPVGAVTGSDGKPHAKHEIARHLHDRYEE